MEEVSDETQARVFITLEDKVRELIRNEIKLALNDGDFVREAFWGSVSAKIVHAQDYNFKEAVKQVLKDQLQKY